MAYATALISSTQKAPQSEGNKLGRQAIRLNFSVIRIAKATGATRQTVYNWFVGRPIAPYYTPRVTALIEILSSADTAEHAWRKVCSKFALKT